MIPNGVAQAPEDELDEPPFPVAVVSQLLSTFAKAVRAHQLYLPNNPMYARAIDAVREAFVSLWQHTDAIDLQVTETQFRWEGRQVLEESSRTSESLPWTFFKDGIRELKILQGFENDDLRMLLEILQKIRKASAEDDDLLTLMWEQEFVNLQYKYVDLGAESVQSFDGITSREPTEHITPPSTAEAGGDGLASSAPSTVKMEDFDSTLYFLDESEIEYLQTEIKKDFSQDQRPPVIASLLDTFEQEYDPTVREEIVGILDYLLLLMLSTTQFRSAAYVLREAAISATRARDIIPSQQLRLAELTERVSDPVALGQLLQNLEDTPLRPPQHELNELFLQLKPGALETVLGWIGRTGNNELRLLLENAASRLASSHTSELVRLIGSEDDVVVIEAMRRAAALKTPAAVQALGRMISEGPTEMRLTAVNALAEISSPGSLQVLERAVDDEDRDIRIAAVRILGARAHRPGLARIENALKGKIVRESNLSEKMAFFEAYGILCGDGGIPLLEGLLNSKAFLGKREDPELRACAAMSLGKIGTPRATDILRKASGDKDVMVRNAVTRALRNTA